MLNANFILLIIALVLALIDAIQSKSLTATAVVLVCLSLLLQWK